MKEIQLTQNKVAIVDDDDFERISQYNYYFNGKYPCRNKLISKDKYKTWYIHWDVIGKPEIPFQIDHRDGNRLNNSKTNLRMCSNEQNSYNRHILPRNKSGYRGVSWVKNARKWRSQIYFKRKQIYLGLFSSKEDAIMVYNDAAKKYHKEFTSVK